MQIIQKLLLVDRTTAPTCTIGVLQPGIVSLVSSAPRYSHVQAGASLPSVH